MGFRHAQLPELRHIYAPRQAPKRTPPKILMPYIEVLISTNSNSNQVGYFYY